MGPAAAWILFACRELPVEGLFFSPFDLVFGRDKKGVLQLIKQSWLKNDLPEKIRSQNVIDYVLQLRERIRSSIDIVNVQRNVLSFGMIAILKRFRTNKVT